MKWKGDEEAWAEYWREFAAAGFAMQPDTSISGGATISGAGSLLS